VRVYISGVISNGNALTPLQIEANKAKFFQAEQNISDDGHTPINPLRIDTEGKDWRGCLEADIKELLECDAIYMLRGWEASKGARLEFHIACELGLTCLNL
jgi:Domain of unknown function (DUF4406)